MNTKSDHVIVGELLKEEDQILKTEHSILAEETVLEHEVKSLEKKISVLNAFESHRKRVVRRLAKHKFIFSILVSLGVVLVWRGIWDITSVMPVLKDSFVALIVGFAILWYLEKFSEV